MRLYPQMRPPAATRQPFDDAHSRWRNSAAYTPNSRRGVTLGIDELSRVEPEAGHLLAHESGAGFSAAPSGADPATGLGERARDHGALEGHRPASASGTLPLRATSAACKPTQPTASAQPRLRSSRHLLSPGTTPVRHQGALRMSCAFSRPFADAQASFAPQLAMFPPPHIEAK